MQPEENLDSGREWVRAVHQILGEKIAKNFKPPRGRFSYGSDCSGLDAPLWALRMIMEDKFSEA